MAPPSSSAATTSVQVALRIRPPTTQDSTSIPARFLRSVIQATSPNSVSIEVSSNAPSGSGAPAAASVASSASSAKKQFFSFDQVHSPATTQHALFTSTAQPLVSRFVEGFNCTILAYGQTSSGKTFTMTGIDLDADPSDPNNGMGIIPRAVSTIFARAKQIKEERGSAWTYSIKGSFIEIYNEDLIDLLSLDDVAGGRREVQIREDKDGHIIWGGLREVNVKNPGEVMTLIRKGTSIRRTNETDMNAQSSRSHAIFSLTLTQKKYTGSGAPPRSSSPLPPGGRSPSRLARPGSMYSGVPSPAAARIASPTFGRPATPSFAAAMGRGGGGLRPSSALGIQSSDARSIADDDPGEWVTIVSKFHFVDLAGSERLKRTAAAGERIKEGISINSGLLALGNVISALGDPSRAKSHTASHIPYRDSKLTRLLQDSLGGNAHTLMIACVSPAEWNAGETVNTLKYANRARNIKNRAIVNEKEDGWDDVEWLQGTVSRLRKELKMIKDGGVIGAYGHSTPEVLEGAGKKVLAQMTELQNNYEDLREKFVERTEELTRLRRELGVQQRGSTGGTVGGTAKYEEIVGPVIEEYEKTIAAMEAELNLNRAALRHTNEMVEEKEEEFTLITERHAATELYVEELRSRVAKLTEREASTEAYVRDLEEKMKTYDESSITSSESMGDLKREVARFRDTESHSASYIADLEARLARSDESIILLQQTIERLEKESEIRRDEVHLLQSRLGTLKRDGESWRSDLEERERKVKELEEKMESWERKKDEAGETRARLGSVVGEVAHARKSLEVDLASASSPVNGVTSAPFPVITPINGDDTASRPSTPDSNLARQLIALRQTHTATLADLSSVTSKYRDALREISDLAAQIQEARLNSSIPESPAVDKPVEIPPFRRRLTGGRSRDAADPQVNSSGRRHFFRQAASAESLHSRSLSQSLSLSQELSSARSRKASISSHGTSSSMSHSPSNSSSTISILNSHRPTLSITLPSTPGGLHPNSSERSVPSLENEIMRLQEVLKERENEISLLESSLRTAKEISNTGQTAVHSPIADIKESMEPNDDGALEQNGHIEDADGLVPSQTYLSPKTLNQFDHIRKTIENGYHLDYHENISEKGGSASETDENLDRLNELMLSMAQKEAQHREVVDNLNQQLAQVRRQHDDLTTLSRDQAINMSTEFEALRSQHSDDLVKLEKLTQREAELIESLMRAELGHAADTAQIQAEHTTALKAKSVEVDTLVARLKEEHEVSLTSLREELSVASADLERSHREHEELFGKLKVEHEEELRHQLQEVNGVLARTRQEHETAMAQVNAAYEEILKQKEDEASTILQRTEEDYYNALTKLRGDHAEALSKQMSEAAAALERLREEHAGELRVAEIAKEGSLSESQSSQALAIQELQNEHSLAIQRKESAFAEEVKTLIAEHSRALATKDGDHSLEMDKLRSAHEVALTKLKEELGKEIQNLQSSLAASKEESASNSARARQELDGAIQNLKEQQAALLQEIVRGHEEEAAGLRKSHESNLKEVTAAAEERASLLQSHVEESLKLKTAHQLAVTELQASLTAAQDRHRQDLEEARAESDRLIAQEHEKLTVSLAELEHQHSLERDSLRKEHDLLIEELETHKLAADEFTASHEAARRSHERALDVKTDALNNLHQELSAVGSERDELAAEVARLRSELDETRNDQTQLVHEASKRESLVDELEKHRSVLAEMQEYLQRVKDEKDNLQTEKIRQENIVRDLQAQIARSASPPGVRPVPDRNMSYTRATGLPAIKLPPPTPPPSVPPPPAPRPSHVNGETSISSQASSGVVSLTSSRESTLDSPVTSAGPTSLNGTPTPLDPKISTRLDQQAKQIDEQEVMIKTLNKQLTHCESDLQTHMDLVTTLETSLGDSEKNLRKARMHATELARERDTLSVKLEALRTELQEAKREVVTVRKSIVEEKQSLEQRLDEERKAKERARQQLDSRMEEITKRKSKFACL